MKLLLIILLLISFYPNLYKTENINQLNQIRIANLLTPLLNNLNLSVPNETVPDLPDNECMDQLLLVINGFSSGKQWALQSKKIKCTEKF